MLQQTINAKPTDYGAIFEEDGSWDSRLAPTYVDLPTFSSSYSSSAGSRASNNHVHTINIDPFESNSVHRGPAPTTAVRQRHSPMWNPIRVGPPLMIPVDGGPIWVTPVDHCYNSIHGIRSPMQSKFVGQHGPPSIWNPVRVGPSLLIPVNGGPIWVTPVDPNYSLAQARIVWGLEGAQPPKLSRSPPKIQDIKCQNVVSLMCKICIFFKFAYYI